MPSKKKVSLNSKSLFEKESKNFSTKSKRRHKRKAENDTPRDFLRIMRYKEILENKKKGKQAEKKKEENKEQELKIQKGETLGEFSRRVDDELRISLLKAQKVDTKKKEKRKQYLIMKKEKKKNKGNKDNIKDFKDFKDNVKFGEQAYEPPTIKNFPKQRKKNNNNNEGSITTIDNKNNSNNKEVKEKEKNNLSKPKLKSLSLYERRSILTEREKAISNYRMLKQKKLQNHNPFDVEKDEFEVDPEMEFM